MEIYLVGGAIRDRILNLQINEKDYVVVGSSQKEMLSEGFKQVGKKFPVFLHPKTSEEYALARTEIKTGVGHKDFIFETNKNISLEDDLKRRDLTINAIAEDKNGNLIDPFNGIQDLKNKIIRHVSEAFIEDPLRVLRVGRFYSKLAPLGFKIDPSTINLMKDVVNSGEILELSNERLWMELNKAMSYEYPYGFFKTICEIGFQDKILESNLNLKEIESKLNFTKNKDISVESKLVFLELPIDFIEIFGFPKKVLDSHFFFTEYAPKYLSIDFSNKEEILNFILETDGIRKINRIENFLKNISLLISYKYNNQVNNLMLFMSILKNILSSKDRPKINDENVSEIKKIFSNFYMKKIEEILDKKH